MTNKIISTITSMLMMCFSVSGPCFSRSRPMGEHIVHAYFNGLDGPRTDEDGNVCAEVIVPDNRDPVEYTRIIKEEVAPRFAKKRHLPVIVLEGSEKTEVLRLPDRGETRVNYSILQNSFSITTQRNMDRRGNPGFYTRINFNGIDAYHAILGLHYNLFQEGGYIGVGGSLLTVRNTDGSRSCCFQSENFENFEQLENLVEQLYILFMGLENMSDDEKLEAMKAFTRQNGRNVRGGDMEYKNGSNTIKSQLPADEWRTRFFVDEDQ